MNQAHKKCGFDSLCKNVNVYGSQGFNALQRKSKNGILIKLLRLLIREEIVKFLVVGSFQMKNEEESRLDVEEYSLHVCKPGQWLRESINLDFNDNTLRTKMSFALILTVSPRLWSWTCKYPFFFTKKNLFTRQSLRVLMLYILPTFISILTLWILWWAFLNLTSHPHLLWKTIKEKLTWEISFQNKKNWKPA